MTTDFQSFLSWEKNSRDSIDVKKIYIDMAGDLVAGILLSQIIYWYLPSKAGDSKISIIRDGKEWIAKNRDEWWDEIRISPKQFDRAIKELVEIGIIETKLYWFGKAPTKHIRIVKDTFIQLWNSLVIDPIEPSILPKGQNTNEGVFLPKVKMDFTQRSKSYIPESTCIDEIPIAPDKPGASAASETPSKSTSTPPEKPLTKTRVAKRPAAQLNPIKDAIVAAFGWSWDTMTKSEKGTIQKAAAELFDVGRTPDDIPALYRYCKTKYTQFSPVALTKANSHVLKQTANKIVALTTDPTWHKPTDDYYDYANGNGQKPESA